MFLRSRYRFFSLRHSSKAAAALRCRVLPTTVTPTTSTQPVRQSIIRRWASTARTETKKGGGDEKNSNLSAGMYTAAIFISMLGLSYAAVPLYRLFCASTGYSGTPQTDASRFSPQRLVPIEDDKKKRIRVTFESNTSDALPWSFKPELREIYVVPGETALTFYKAKSKADDDIVGIATYNVTPYRAASYFNKIQCFCFEEQRLSPGEDVDMPVFFFIDPDFLEDPYMKDVNTITLSYTLFNAKYAKNLTPGQAN